MLVRDAIILYKLYQAMLNYLNQPVLLRTQNMNLFTPILPINALQCGS